MRRLVALALAALLPAACTRAPPVPVAQVHYQLGEPYELGGVWHYPREQYGAILTGLAVVDHDARGRLTADGEAYNPDALTVASRTVQLPAIARLTDLDTGQQLLVRVNDRGPANLGRLVAVTPRVASLLGFPPDGIARVRLEVLPAESHAVADSLPGAPHLAIAAAPREAVLAQSLSGPARTVTIGEAPAPAATPSVVLSGQVTQGRPEPGTLYVRLSRFTDRRYAVRQAAQVDETAQIVRVDAMEGAGYRARLGPFATVAEADVALDRAVRAGVTDARIVVE